MEIPGIGTPDPHVASNATGSSALLGKDAFMNLLVTQLANQNPLSPMQDQEFVAQLAQFSSLEQLENMNSTMSSSLLMSQSLNNSLATNLIGKEVLVDGASAGLGESGDAKWQVTLGGDANVKAVVRDSSGAIVRTIDLGAKKTGPNEVVWDGKNDAGDRVASGSYTLEITATDSSGQAVSAQTRVRALVTGVRFAGGMGYLMLGDVSLPLGSVVEVVAPQNAS
ncbi:MAG TPA: flagellar hook capping FlgD N-terminal domain-containing protein [bacterium]|nr:flagellar hook capping FlgD N-terminal domain-containing protein [bacterium]